MHELQRIYLEIVWEVLVVVELHEVVGKNEESNLIGVEGSNESFVNSFLEVKVLDGGMRIVPIRKFERRTRLGRDVAQIHAILEWEEGSEVSDFAEGNEGAIREHKGRGSSRREQGFIALGSSDWKL